MRIQDYTFFLIVAECDRPVLPTLPLMECLTTLNRIARLRDVNNKQFELVIGIRNHAPANTASEFAYIGYVFGQFKAVPTVVAEYIPDADADLASASCFMLKREF
jgi:hypothetical protein